MVTPKLQAKINRRYAVAQHILRQYDIEQPLAIPLVEYSRYVLRNGSETEKTALSDGSFGFVPFGDNWYFCLTQGVKLTFGQGPGLGIYLLSLAPAAGQRSLRSLYPLVRSKNTSYFSRFAALHEPLLLRKRSGSRAMET